MKNILMVMSIIIAVSATVLAVPVPVSHWALDGNTTDSGSLANNGTLVGNPQYVDGRVGQAIQFDGDGDGVLISTPSDYLDTTFSISFWVKIPNGIRPHGIAIGKAIHNLTALALKGLGWTFQNDTSSMGASYENLWMVCRPANGARRDLNPSYYDTVRDGKWHHIVAVVNAETATVGDIEAELYVDGVSKVATTVFEKSSMTDAAVASQPLAFGYMPNGPGSWDWEGIIDDVQYFNVALTATDVTDILTAAGGGCETLEGDADGDCEVDIDDLKQVANDWLESGVYVQ